MKYIPQNDAQIRLAIRSRDFDTVIKATWPLATKTARKYAGGGYELDDAVQDALLEIHRAALAFDLNGGVPFLALALKYMHNQLASRKYEAARTMPINRATGWQCNRVASLVRDGVDEIDACREVNIPHKTYKAARATESLIPITLIPVGREIPSSDDATSSAMAWAVRQSIGRATQGMTLMEQRAIRDKMNGRRLTQTAREIGMSNQRVHQAYQSAIKKMKTVGRKYLESWVIG